MFGKKTGQEPALCFFTVYDSKTKMYKEPFPAPNRAVVLRDFQNSFKKKDAHEVNLYFQNAEDYSLFEIGSFDFTTGLIQSGNLEHVANLHDLRSAVQVQGIVAT